MAPIPRQAKLSVSAGVATELVSATAAAGGQGSLPAAASSAWPAALVEDIPPKPIKRHHISDEVAEMLATLPRKKWDESTWAALGGAIAALPSAADACYSAFQRQPFSLHMFETAQVAIFLGFSVWFFSRKRSKGEKTSGDLLKELRQSESGSAEGGSGA